MSVDPSRYHRRDDGVLQLLRPVHRKDEALRGFEMALTVVALALAAGSATADRPILAGVLLAVAVVLAGTRLVRDKLTERAASRKPKQPVATATAERTGLRVIRLEERGGSARGAETPVRPPGTAASPRE